MDPEPPADLAPLRAEIDDVDRRLLELLDRRARAALRIGEIKRARRLPVYAPDREAVVLARAAQAAADGHAFPAEALTAIYRAIIGATRALEGHADGPPAD